jgi:hypothetical protein
MLERHAAIFRESKVQSTKVSKPLYFGLHEDGALALQQVGILYVVTGF